MTDTTQPPAGRLSLPQKRRLQVLMRPGYISVPVGSPDKTDISLAKRGLVDVREHTIRIGMFVTSITAKGREAVPEDDYEYCGCGGLTHRQEAACLHCGASKEWAA